MANYKNKSYEINNNNIYKWRKIEWKFKNIVSWDFTKAYLKVLLELIEEYGRKLEIDIEYKELKEKFENKFKETKENLDDFSEKVKVKAEAFTEVLIFFI